MPGTIPPHPPVSSATVPPPASPPPAPKCSSCSTGLPSPPPPLAGPDWGPSRLVAPLRCLLVCRVLLQLFAQLRHQLRHHFFGIPLHWAAGLRRFRLLSVLRLRIAILFQGSIS